MSLTTDPDRGALLASSSLAASDTSTKYYIYSSSSGQSSSSTVQVLAAGTNTDNFVSQLPNQVIILSSTPNLTSTFDSTDLWYQWMSKFDPAGTFSLTVDNATDKKIQSFQFKFTSPWDVTFSSSADALLYSFGTQQGTDGARVPVPGLPSDGSLLYCGLDASKTGTLTSTVKGLFSYAGLPGMASFLPSSIADMSVTLDASKASEKHNALWFNPSFHMQTTVRLQFGIDAAGQLQTVLNDALPGFSITSADAIVKKVLMSAVTEKGPMGLDQGQVFFSLVCSVKPKDSSAVDMVAGVECRESGFSLTFQMNSSDALPKILAWLAGLISDDLGIVQDILKKDQVFDDSVYLRMMKVCLDTSEDPKKPTLASFEIDIEVKANFGKGSDGKAVVFLVTYSWSRDGGKLGSIRGQLWNWFNFSSDHDLSPYYEAWTDLQPLTKPTPATSLSIDTLIHGDNKIENIPANLPSKVTQAYIFLSQSTFGLGGTMQSLDLPSGPVPQIDLGLVSLNASYSWGNSKDFSLSIGVMVEIKPSATAKHQDPAVLIGSLDYSTSAKTWLLTASLDGLYASTLYKFFDQSSAEHVMPLIDSIEIANMQLEYRYTAQTSGPQKGKSVGSYFKFEGVLLVAALELDLMFEYDEDWTLTAALRPQDATATLGDIIASILGDDELDLPEFLANMQFGGQGNAKDNIGIDVHKGKDETNTGGSESGTGTGAGTGPGTEAPGGGSFQFIAAVAVGPLALTFAQYHASAWAATVPSKRLVKVALTALPEIDIPLIGSLTQPFDEMYYMWIQDDTNQNQSRVPGLTRKDIRELNTSLRDQLVSKDKFKEKKDEDVLMGAGSHFAVVIKDSMDQRTCILDYDFKKQPQKTPPATRSLEAANTSIGGDERSPVATAPAGDIGTDGGKQDSDGSSASAPFKKRTGPLSISNVGLKYLDKKLHIMFDATFELGPLSFSLIGFNINLELTSLDISKIPFPTASIQGFSAAFEKPPLTIAGIIRHGNTGDLNYYAGGLIVGFVPYQLQAAGFYGKASPPGGSEFTSVFIFARLDGPLITLEFAEISGVTGGFGYKSDVRIPTADQIANFPFIATHTLDGATGSAVETLERLTSPDADGWFRPLDNTYWAAAGMKIDAFQMVALDAVVVVQFGQSIKFGVFAVALVDIPTAKSPAKYAHIELGIAIVVDFDYGILKAEAQLSPNSYILHPDCHLTGGFGLYYWFDAPHADLANVGSFVLTLGGYHQAFAIPDGYPNPPRLGISWSVGKHLSITGGAYFAITPKICMGGGHLHASFHAGPITAWFDAFADFLINYKPFHFTAGAGIAVGVRYDLDALFIHTHVSAEISAELYLWGPPVAGRMHIDFWITSIDINFGDTDTSVPPVTLIQFYELVLQASSKEKSSSSDAERSVDVTTTVTRPKNEGHTFLVQSGLMNNSDVPERQPNAPRTVRAGTFSFVVSCKMAISKAERVNDNGKVVDSLPYTTKEVYAKPMKITTPLNSTMTVEITQVGVPYDHAQWGMERFIKPVPTGLWAKYDPNTDPSGGNNHIGSLLNNADGGVPLMMGVLFTAPPPTMAPDKLPTFNITDADLQELIAENAFPAPQPSHGEWEPDAPAEEEEQWEDVREKWETPEWGTGDDGQAGFVGSWAKAFGWDVAVLKMLAGIPKRLDAAFGEVYVAAPLLTK